MEDRDVTLGAFGRARLQESLTFLNGWSARWVRAQDAMIVRTRG